MTAQRLIPREDWERWLVEEQGCRPCEESERRIKTGELWLTMSGLIFPVPVEDSEGRMRFDEKDQVRITLERLRQRMGRL